MGASSPPELARLLQAADPASREGAWDVFVATYSPILLNTARSVGRTYDAAMDAYAYALEALRQDDFKRLRAYRPMPGSKFTTWLVMVARRLCVDQLRRHYGQLRGEGPANAQVRLVRTRLADLLAEAIDPDELSEPAEAGPDHELRSRELERALATSVAALEPRDRLLLSLRFEDGRPAREIADIMRFPTLFHVYRRLNRVLEDLKTSLRRRGVEGPTP